jgi:uncharacterized protein (TIGR03437 family)
MRLLRGSIICSVLPFFCVVATAAPTVSAVLNAASFVATPLAPGEFMEIHGAGLSSSTSSCPAAGTTCNNTSVLVNGSPVPVIFVSPTVAQFYVPWGISGATATVQVSNQGVTSTAVNVGVAAVAPGVFTLSGTGSGVGVFADVGLHTINAANPARSGDTVSVFANGLGATNPTVADGALATGTEHPTATITVTVGGLPASVTFSSLVPGQIGVDVVQFVVPAGLFGNQTVIVSANGVPAKSVILPLVEIPLRFIPVTPCRVADTREPTGPLGGPRIAGSSTRNFFVTDSLCGIPLTAKAYSLNVAVVPGGPLGYLTVWPTGQPQPLASTLNSLDGRVKSNAAIVPAGTGGAISVFASNPTDVVLDINGYFIAATDPAGLAFFPLTPCRVADTRNPDAPLGGPFLTGGVTRSFPVLSATACAIPGSAQAYSLNFAAIPGGPLGYLTAWPTGLSQPIVASLNAPTGAITANAAIIPAGAGGSIDIFASNNTDLVIDINGYFAPMAPGGLSLRDLTPCRVLDTRLPSGAPPFSGLRNVTIAGGSCAVPDGQAYVLSAAVVPPGPLGYLTMWPTGQSQPTVATLNAVDAAVTSNLAIVPASGGKISAFASNPVHLILDIFGYFAP